MKKFVLWAAILLVALIPTYILIFQAVKYNPPDVSLNGDTLDPTMYRWANTPPESDEQLIVDTTEWVDDIREAEENFKEEVTILASFDELKKISFSAPVDGARLSIFDINSKKTTNIQYADFHSGKATYTPIGDTQITLIIWVNFAPDKSESYYAAYSFEVKA